MVYRAAVKQALRLRLLMALVVVASACGGDDQRQEAKARPLPEEEKALPLANIARRSSSPRSELQGRRGLDTRAAGRVRRSITHAGTRDGGLGFANVQEVYVNKPTR